MEEPFKRWRLKLEGKKNTMDLVFDCYTPVYDYNAEMRALPEKVAAMKPFRRPDSRISSV